MASTPLVAIEAPTGTTGSDGLAVFTFPADIDKINHRIAVDRLDQGNTLDYTVTGTRQITFTAGNIPVAGAKVWLFNGVAGVTATTSLPTWATVAEVISDAAIELGLVATDIADPFSSSDPNILQLVRMLRSGGRSLAKHRDWHHLQKEFTFSTLAAQTAYPLPTDYRKLIPDTEWNRTSQFPLGGPIDASQWQALQARRITSTVTVLFRVWQGQIFLQNPSDNQTIAFEYQSSSWIMPAGQASATSETPAAASDTVCFDPSLVVARLKMDFRRNKKQDSQAEQDDYVRALAAAENEDAQGKTIYLGGSRRYVRRIDSLNLPAVIG